MDIKVDDLAVEIRSSNIDDVFIFMLDEDILIYTDYVKNQYIKINSKGIDTINTTAKIEEISENEISVEYSKSYIIYNDCGLKISGFSEILSDSNIERMINEITTSLDEKKLLSVILNKK